MKIRMRRYMAFFVVILCIASFYALADQGSDNKVLQPGSGIDKSTGAPILQATVPVTPVLSPHPSVTPQNVTPDITTNPTTAIPTTTGMVSPTSPAPITTTLPTTSSPTPVPSTSISITSPTPTPTVQPTSTTPVQTTQTAGTPTLVTATTAPTTTGTPAPTTTTQIASPTVTTPLGVQQGELQSSTSSLGPSDTYAPDEVIVKFKPEKMVDTGNKGKTIAKAHSAVSATVVDDYDQKGLSGMQVVKLKPGKSVDDAIAEYENNPDVLYAVPNYKINLFTTPNDPSYSQQWALPVISAPQAWSKITGSNTVVIAVLDTGVDYNHPDLVGNIWVNAKEVNGNSIDDDKNGYVDDVRGWNFVEKNNNPMDTNGHGSQCAGIAGAIGNNNLGISGVDWNVRVLPLKVIGSQGYGYESDAIDAILYANQMGADVISISWGGSGFDQALKDAIDASPALVVCAAGNSGQNNDNSPVYPASYASANIISVAASDQDDNLCLLYTSPSPRDGLLSRMPSSA